MVMPEESDRPSIETKAQMKARHAAELQASGFDSKLKKYGAWAAALSAIIGLCIMIGTQVWPWMVQFGVKTHLQALQENTKALKELTGAQKDTYNLLMATIKAADEQTQEDALKAQRLHDSIQALKMEVRLRHGVLDIDELGSLSLGITDSSGGGGGPSRATASVRMSPAQRLQAVTRRADSKLEEAKSDSTSNFKEDVKAQIKTLPIPKREQETAKAKAMAF